MDIADVRRRVEEHFSLGGKLEATYYGKWAAGTRKHTVVSPVDGEPVADVMLSDTTAYEDAVKASTRAFEEWREWPAPKRGQLIRKIGERLREERDMLGLVVTLEVGKTITEGQGEIQEMIDISDFSLGLSRQVYGLTMASERPHHRLYEQWLPLGPVGVITAFNFPASVWSWNSFIAATVGDTVIWKPSTKAVLTAIMVMRTVAEVVEEELAPPIFTMVAGPGVEMGEMLASDPRVPLISFTGSVRTGRRIAERVSSRLGRTILELGGNNAAIVSDKADMEVALKGVLFGALATAGQRCTSTRRVIVSEKIYSEFVSRLVKAYSSVRVGDPSQEGVLVGPLIDREAVEKFTNAVKRAEEEGGKVLFGGRPKTVDGLRGYYVEPTIIEARKDMEICREETFAPILYVFKYRDLREAIEIHNSVPQGLSSAIFTTDLREEEEFLSPHGSDCGIANVNTSTAGAEIGGAFGGEKETGGGRESGSDAWKNYMRRQTVTKNYGHDLPLAQGVRFDI